MEIEVYTRHSPDCPYFANRFSRKCKCRKWLYISPPGKRVSAKTRSWEQADKLARQMVAGKTVPPATRTVRGAVESYTEDKKQQSLSVNWERKIRRELDSLSAWCDRKAIVSLGGVELEHLEAYRKEWGGAAISRRKRQERLRQFFRYCQRHGWIDDNPAALLSPIRVTAPPTMPITREQFDAALRSAGEYNPKAPDKEWRRRRARVMLLLLRWSGLRLGDAARLERSALSVNGDLRLYMQKTGEAVMVPLPPEVVKELMALGNSNDRYFFWSGKGPLESTVKRWWSTLKAIFRAAGMPDAHPHQIRDSFAVEYLLAGVPIDQVSIMLGHGSVKITEKHYAAFTRARQEQLLASVRKAWGE